MSFFCSAVTRVSRRSPRTRPRVGFRIASAISIPHLHRLDLIYCTANGRVIQMIFRSGCEKASLLLVLLHGFSTRRPSAERDTHGRSLPSATGMDQACWPGLGKPPAEVQTRQV